MTRPLPGWPLWVLAASLAALACSPPSSGKNAVGVTQETHPFFAITPGSGHELGRPAADGPIVCESCHPSTATSFAEFSCVGCHEHEQTLTALMHQSEPKYQYVSKECRTCHPDGAIRAFDHAGISKACSTCHDVGALFASLPLAGFTHPERGNSDCSGCHKSLVSWKGGSNTPAGAHDPERDLTLTALVPAYVGTSMVSVSPLVETLKMTMNHQTTQVVAATFKSCSNCHADASAGLYYPGNLHGSLTTLKLPAPSLCSDCHAETMPTGFVGPLAISPARAPASGEMKHDAVLWANGKPTTTPAVPQDCATCHISPTGIPQVTWATSIAGASPVEFHSALMAAGKAQPTSCIDCHANSRPNIVLTPANSAVPANLEFDHTAANAQGDCVTCHAPFTAWAGQFHAAGSPNPPTCLPCHQAERPTTTSSWTSPTYTQVPFDYVVNSVGVKHGNDQDCATCHSGPGTGAWGGTQNWVNGKFNHGPASSSASSCITCHTTQRPDLQPGTTPAAMATLIGFDHSINGTGNCFGCHQATVAASTYLRYFNAATGTLPNGDWKGGQPYPGSTPVGSPTQFVRINSLKLNRSGAYNLITSTTSAPLTLYNEMLHISTALPAALNAGPAGAPDNSKCWHCHTNTGGTVTSYSNGKFHASLTNYRATPGGALAPFPQPTSRCTDCHVQMRPTGLVQKAGSVLQAMDHNALFTGPVTIGGATVTSAAGIDCSRCHTTQTGTAWSDGLFHSKIAAAVPQDCTACHYPLMADSAQADVTSGANFAMRHRSGQLTFQACQTCHVDALTRGATTPNVAPLWKVGAYHPSLSAQPTACLECHAGSDPAPNASTASATLYRLALGGTATNSAQWMNHGSNAVVGKDCAVCHALDAKKTGSAWSKSVLLHPGRTVTTCRECHGLTNGAGSTPGASNNLPQGLTNSTTPTTASRTASTGVPAGTLAQINHADVNASARDCNFCHTQVGASTTAGVQGKEWTVATFHSRFNSSSPLIANGTTGRCSNCHMNSKPGAAYPTSHALLSSTSGTTDCSSCHSWPGTGSPASATSPPNWLGAVGGAPQYIPVGGFSVSQPPASSPRTQVGINNLPHPPVAGGAACTTCHSSAGGGKNAKGYDHVSALINSNCSSCHEAGSNLVGTTWNGASSAGSGAGDTRPFSSRGLVVSFKGNTRPLVNDYQHFYPADCRQCHGKPAGTSTVTTGAAYQSTWRFIHNEGAMSGTCNMCHSSPNNLPN